MMKFSIILILVIVTSSSNNGNNGAIFYNFDNFTLMDFSQYKSTDDYHVNYITILKVDDLIFNFGIPITWSENISIALIKYKDDKNFYPISPAQSWAPKEIGNNISFGYNSILLIFPKCEKNIGPYNETPQLIMNFSCSKSTSLSTSLNFNLPFYYYLQISGEAFTCPKVFSAISYIFFTFKFLISTILLIIGLELAFLGKKFIGLSLFFCVLVSTFILALIPFNWNIDPTNQSSINSSIESIVMVPSVISTVISILSLKFDFIGEICKGMSLGVIIILIIYNTIFHSVFSDTILYWICGIFGVLFGILGFRNNFQVQMLAFPFFGSFLIIHVIGTNLGGYPNEAVIHLMIKAGISFPNIFYAYLAATLIFVFVGFGIQEYITRAEKRKKTNRESIDDLESKKYSFIKGLLEIKNAINSKDNDSD